MDWPSCFPDINLIENVWNLLKYDLMSCFPWPSGEQGMARVIEKEWVNIELEDILGFTNRMPAPIKAVIVVNCSYTKW